MICIAWSGFPQYAARCVGAFVRNTDERVVVVATKPLVPIRGMEKYCECEINWVDENAKIDILELLGEMPRVILLGGWGIRLFNDLRDQVRSAGGKALVAVDNNYQFSFKEVLKAIRFRLKLRRCYDGYFVPGKSGVKLLRFYGVPKERIQVGMYAADASLFKSTVPICERQKRIIYVGQICERKNVRRLVEVFLSLADRFPEWSLDLYGSGPLTDEINRIIKQSQSQAVHLHAFAQPEELAALYGNSRIFILPSLEEHWGLVVHEAALSGCVLLTSRQVGAADDFVTSGNGRMFDAFDEKSMAQALIGAMSFSDEQFSRAEQISVSESANASLDKFAEGLQRLSSK